MYSHIFLVTGARDWDSRELIRQAFNDAWQTWGTAKVTRPLLVSGHAKDGADALAEELWRVAGFEVKTFPADWAMHGNVAGRLRNQQMVNFLVAQRRQQAQVMCAAFIDLCRKPACPQEGDLQLMPYHNGHYSHGTMHCRSRAIEAGIRVNDVLHPNLPPF